MKSHEHWWNSYRHALHACGDKAREDGEADKAIRVCIKRLSQISPKQTPEREAVRVALSDLKLLKRLYRKYSGKSQWTDQTQEERIETLVGGKRQSNLISAGPG